MLSDSSWERLITSLASRNAGRPGAVSTTFPPPPYLRLDKSQRMFPREAGKAIRHTFHSAALVASRTFDSDAKALPPLPLSFRSRPLTLPSNDGHTAGSLVPSTAAHVAACLKTADETALCPRGDNGNSSDSDSDSDNDSDRVRNVGGNSSDDGQKDRDCDADAVVDTQDILWICLTPPARSSWTGKAAVEASTMARKYHFEHISVILVDGATTTTPGLCVLQFVGGHGLEKNDFPWLLSDRSLDLITKGKGWVHLARDLSPGSKLEGIGCMINRAVVIFTFFKLRMIYLDVEGLRRDAGQLLRLLPFDNFD